MRTIEETITREREKAKIHRFNSCNIDTELYADDTEAIEDAKERCIKCAEEHEQLAEWLEELKDYRDKNKMIVRIDVENMDSIKDKIEELSKYAEIQYNKALDDFVNFANTMPTVEEEDGEIRPMWLEEMEEQLKACVKE